MIVDATLIGFGVIAFAIGVAIYVTQFRQGLRADASKRWPTGPGTVTACALEQVPGKKWRYRAAIEYRFRVGARDYRSTRVFWGGNEGRKRHMASVTETYPAGCSVIVHYDPRDPAEAVIDPIQNTGSRPLVLYAMAMMALGLFAFTGGLYALLH